MNEENLPKRLKDLVSGELRTGEFVSWVGMPVPHYFDLKTSLMFLVGIVWTAFTVLWVFTQPFMSSTFITILVGIPSLTMGVALMSAPIWSYRKAMKTVYIITNMRALTVMDGSPSRIMSCSVENLQNAYCREHRDGMGDVIISAHAAEIPAAQGHESIDFRHLENPREIEKKLRALASVQSSEG